MGMSYLQKNVDALMVVAEKLLDRLEAVEAELGITKGRKLREYSASSVIAKALANPSVTGRTGDKQLNRLANRLNGDG
jgi:hypothetical protein